MANNGFSGGGGGDRFYESNLGKDVVNIVKQNSLILFLFLVSWILFSSRILQCSFTSCYIMYKHEYSC